MSHHRVIIHLEVVLLRLTTTATEDRLVAVDHLERVLRAEVAVHLLPEEGKNPM